MIQNAYELSNYTQWTSVTDGETFLHDVATETGVLLDSIGKSFQGRELYRYTLGSGERSIIITGGVHGIEPASREAVLLLARDLAYQSKQLYADFLSEYKIMVVPTVNPDRMHITRNNDQELNINRDFYLLQTPEARALATLLANVQPEIYIDFHERGGNVSQQVEFINPMNLSPNSSPYVKNKTNEMTDYIRLQLESQGYVTADYPQDVIGDAMSVASASYLGSLSFTPETNIGVTDKYWRVTALQKVFDLTIEWFMINNVGVQSNLIKFNNNPPIEGESFTLLNDNEEYYASATKHIITLPKGYQLENISDFQSWIDVYNFEVDSNGFVPINQKYGRLLPRLLDPQSTIAVTNATRIESLPENKHGRWTKVLYDEWRDVFIRYM